MKRLDYLLSIIGFILGWAIIYYGFNAHDDFIDVLSIFHILFYIGLSIIWCGGLSNATSGSGSCKMPFEISSHMFVAILVGMIFAWLGYMLGRHFHRKDHA